MGADSAAGLTEAGWPRPWFAGTPIPWVSPAYRLGETDGDRREWTKHERGCQVCGVKHEEDAQVVAFLSGPLVTPEGSGTPSAKFEPERLNEIQVWAMDDGILHERCARLAAKHCPKLSGMKEEGTLFAFAAPVWTVRDRDELTASGGIIRRLWLPGRHCRPVPM